MQFPYYLVNVLIMSSIINRSLGVIIVPAPTVTVEEASHETITIAWTMPINEDYDNFTITVSSDSDIQQVVTINVTSAVIENLTPGIMYEISITAQRQQLQSDPAQVKQDTVPLPPTNLKLSCFDEILLKLEGPFFGDAEFSVEVYGIEANWVNPDRGASECYDSWIEPSGGPVAASAENNEVDPGSTVRQYLQLVPGTTYTVFVRSSTCGNGFLGRLHSAPIQESLTLKPANPPPITVDDLTSSTANLLWKADDFPGFYDDFELSLFNGTMKTIFVATPTDPTSLGRNLTGLQSCTEYNLQLFTLLNGVRSKRSQNVTFFTLPSSPFNLQASQITETTFLLRWNVASGGILTQQNFNVLILPTNTQYFSEGNSIYVTSLSPGLTYTTAVSSVCARNVTLQSEQVEVVITTKPLPPLSADVNCVSQTDEFGVSTGQSVLSVTWSSPKQGFWDGFVVDYSPYQFNTLENYLSFVSSSDPNEINIPVPADGRVFTVFLRSVRGNMLSNATASKVTCGSGNKRMITHCRTSMLNWRIIISFINDGAQMLIQIPNFPMHNATIDLANDFIVTKNYTIIIDNPCGNPYPSKISVNPVCFDNQPCYIVTRRLCVINAKLGATDNLCCSERSYNPQRWKCCHSQLQDRNKENMECCYTRWYDSSHQQCCGHKNKIGIVRDSGSPCE
uniref:Fibronectin n=1 Tax=Phallusia mammillata TaxID=59560 RepID=A0A6F9DCG2_9ASCI|nr:fibronectin [Phallusia mammillata]